jgi:arylformamidase
MISFSNYKIIDISQPVSSSSACFPGDIPFSKRITLSYDQSKVFNLTAMTLSPHIGTHADSPSHIGGVLDNNNNNIGFMPLEPYIGPVLVIDISPFDSAIAFENIEACLKGNESLKRILVKTQKKIRYDVFEQNYAYFHPDLVDKLAEKEFKLLGIDTPSVDHTDCKDLKAHHLLHENRMAWLENLDLTEVKQGVYFLIAFPLKFMELEASPVRAVLLAEK